MLATPFSASVPNSPNVYVAHVSLTCRPSAPLCESLQQRFCGHQKVRDTLLDLVELLLRLLRNVRPTPSPSSCAKHLHSAVYCPLSVLNLTMRERQARPVVRTLFVVVRVARTIGTACARVIACVRRRSRPLARSCLWEFVQIVYYAG